MALKRIIVSVFIYVLYLHSAVVCAQGSAVNEEKVAASVVEEHVEEVLSVDHQQAVTLAREGKLISAYRHIQEAYRDDPQNPKIIADHLAISAWTERYDEAVTLYREHQVIDLPDYAMKEVIRSLRETGDYAQAIRLAEDFLRARAEGDIDVTVGLIYSLIQAKDHAEAAARLAEAKEAYPDTLRFRSLQALLFAVRKQWDELLGPAGGIEALVTDGQDPAVVSDLNEAFYLAYDEAIAIARSERYDEALSLLDRLGVFKHKSQQVESDRIVINVWQEKFDEAVDAYARMNIETDPPPYFLKEVARAYKKTGEETEMPDRHRRYIESYVQAIEEEELRSHAQLDVIRVRVEEGNLDEAVRLIDGIPEDDLGKPEALFLKAKIYDSTKEYWKAVHVYNRILKMDPDNHAALNLKLRSLMDLGATSLVLEESEKHPGVVDAVIAERAKTNVPMHQIRWDEPALALDEIKQLEEKYADLLAKGADDQTASENYDRIKWDRFLALRKEEKMDEIVRGYEAHLIAGDEIPPWVHRAAGDAYLYLQRPEEALEIFNKLIEEDQSFDLEMSAYYTLIELGRYEEAQDALDRLDDVTPAKVVRRGILQDNWQKADIAFNKAWLLMYQDRLKEAEAYIQETKKVSPFNTHLRTAEAHNHLYRGWKRRALDEFKMVRTLENSLISAQIGYARALNENMKKKEAREEIKDLLKRKPANKHVQCLLRQFDVEEMSVVTFDASYTAEDPGEDEYVLSLRGDQPIGFQHTLFAEVIRRETTQEGGNDVACKVRVGDIWQVNNNWRLIGAITGDYEKTDGVGFLGGIQYQLNDCWTFDFGYESDTFDISSRLRADGVEADLYTLSATYRMSELFDTTIGVTFKDFTDNNEYLQYFWRTDMALTTSAYWKTRLGTEFSYETFSDQNVAYYSPEETYSFYFVPMVEHTWFRRYEKAWVDRMYLGVGQKWQSDFGASGVGYVRYEQDHKFSDTKSWLIGTTYSLNEYDGESVNALNVYTTVRFKF